MFDPNGAALADSGIFGLPFSIEESSLVLLPVPWDATTSYGVGASHGPQAIFNASKQIDLFDRELGNFFEKGIAMLPISEQITHWNKTAFYAARRVISGHDHSDDLAVVNDLSVKLNQMVYQETKKLLMRGKKVGLVGGDHSTPLGCIQAHLEKYKDMSILHIDAHADLRASFEGFEYSHASIMHNVMTKTALKQLVQVGIRDFCEAEFEFIKNNPSRITTFFDLDLAAEKFQGQTWSTLCETIIQPLSSSVYISFDIDGLDPRFCPHTGTPVPGGLDFQEVLFLFKVLTQSGRRIVGFDLNEVSLGASHAAVMDPSQEWDANVGARLLYKLCGYTHRT